MTCIIFTNGIINNYKFFQNDFKNHYIIACDGGLKHIHKLNITPNILIGDFDSVDKELLCKYDFVEKIQYPTNKNFTDTELGLLHAKEKGYKDVFVFGATGGRLDHTLGNIFLLKKAYNLGLNVRLVDELQEIQYLNFGQHTLYGCENKTISIIPIENIEFNKSSGLLYPLDNLKFSVGDTRPISNVALENKVLINVKIGSCLIIITNT